MKRISKQEFAQLAGISSRTLQRYLARYRDTLQALGQKPTDKLLSPRALRYLSRELDVELEDS